MGQELIQTLKSPELPTFKYVVMELISELNARQYKDRTYILVMDDYHFITEPDIHRAMNLLIRNLPPQLRLVISTRADPPLPLARLRANGLLNELRALDLRFNRGEITAFLNSTMGLALSPEEIAAMETRTEGWAASLRMAAISMKGCPDIPAFIASFKGTQRHVFDYLTEEVLSLQTRPTRSFLMETSILERLCGPLCEAVTGQANGQAALEKLERANLFLMPVDEDRHWYRYHHLFASMLSSRLRSESNKQPARIDELHRRAAKWFGQNEFIEESIRHALEAHDYRLSARLIAEAGPGIVMRSELATILNWARNLPEEVIRSFPELCLFYAYLLFRTGLMEASEAWLERTEHSHLKPTSHQFSRILRAGLYALL